MENQKFTLILNGSPQVLNSQQIMQLGVHCSGLSLSLDQFINIAKVLYQTNRDHCYEFLKFVEKHQLNRNSYKDFHHQPAKIQIYNCLMALTLSKALRQTTKQAADALINEAIKYMNLSIDVKKSAEKTVILLRGFMTYYKGDFNNAFNILVKSCQEASSASGQSSMSTISLIGLAEINFVKKNYAKSLQYYKKALISNKNLPSKARLGMGYCFFELQKYELADLCFRRIIKLDPNCADAYIGLAVVRYKDDDFGGYFSNIKKAYQLDPNSPLVLLHLAEHFFLSSQKQKAKQLCLKGLQVLEKSPKFLRAQAVLRNDHAQYKARFKNIIAQIHHSNNQFEQALKYYTQVKGKGFLHNQVGLAQCYIQANMLKQALQILQNMSVKNNIKQLKLVSEIFKTIGYLQVKMQAKPMGDNGPNFYYKQAVKYNPLDYETHIDYSVFLSEHNKQKTLNILLKALEITKQKNIPVIPELLNNIGVFSIENHNYNQAITYLKQSKQLLGERTYENIEEEDKLKYDSLYLTINFNFGVALEKLNLITQAIAVHHKIVQYNKYYIDSYVKIAEMLHRQGQTHEAFQCLDQAIQICGTVKLNSMRMDKLVCMKGHLQHADGGNLDAKETMKKLGKNKYQYGTFYDICLGYETVIKKQYQPTMVKDFIRPNREYLIGVCSNDHHNFYSYMLLTVLLITDKKISREQGSMYFNQLKVAELDFPQILFNLGLYQIMNAEYEGALFSLTRFKEKSRSQKANQYIALIHYLRENYDECIRALKINIAIEPNNIRYRFQLACALEKRLYKKFEEGKNVKQMSKSYQSAVTALKLYEQFTKLNPGNYMRGVDNPNLKDHLRNQITRIRSICEERLRILSSTLKHYKKLQLQMIEKERIRKDLEAKKLQQLEKAKQKKFLMDQLMDDQEEQEKEKQRERERKQRLIERARDAMAQAEKEWEIIKQNDQLKKQSKKKRNTNPEGKKPKRERKGQKNQEKAEQDMYPSEEEFQGDYGSYENEYEEDPEVEKPKKHKKKDDKQRKKKKKKQKERRRQREQGEQGHSKENSSVKEEEEDDGEQSEPLKRERSGSLSEEDIPKKKKKKNEEEQDDLGLDLEKYMV